jgi:hypothetical protein
MPQTKVDFPEFKRFSAALTGLKITKLPSGDEVSQLFPGVDPPEVRLAEKYCQILKERLDPQQLNDLKEMLDKFGKKTMTVEQLLDDAKFGPLARCILKLWMLGAWYDPLMPAKLDRVVSSQAYKESLVWRAMQSHPMGYSMLPFEHWSKEPQPLKSFFDFA